MNIQAMVNMVAPDQMIDALMTVPYVEGAGEMSGADCWGIIELWHEHVLNITLEDRASHQPGHGGLQAGFNADHDWLDLSDPKDHCLVVMRSHGFEAGHIGIYYQGHVLHTDKPHGCIYQPIEDRLIRTRITKLAIHKDI